MADLESGSSEDCNGNQVLDECEFAPLAFVPLEGEGGGFPVASVPLVAVAADFNGDGVVDLATGNHATNSSSISLLLSRGDRSFEPAVDFEAGRLLSSMTARDLDQDGDPDLATANRTDVLVIENRGDGTFSAPVEFSAASETRFVTASDVTGDGAADLVTASAGENTVSVLENQGSGTFGTPVSFGAGSEPISVAPADLDQDGDLDLAVANRDSADISVLLNEGDGSFAAAVSYEAGGRKPFSVLAGDLDGDGAPDLAAATSRAISVLASDGSGRFGAPVSYTSSPSSLASGDLDGDGDLDLAYGSVRWGAVSVLAGDGAGRFSPVGFRVPGVGWALSAADLDGDGDLDLAASIRPDRIVVLWNGDEGAVSLLSFHPPTTFPAGGDPHTADLGDLDGDGDVDVVTGNNQLGISVLMNEGFGTFTRPARVSLRGDTFSIVAADLDGDTDLDLVSTDEPPGSNRVQILLNRGDGTYRQAGTYGVGGSPFHVTVGDLNGDGFLDLITSNRSSGTVSLLLNAGDGTFGGLENIRVGSGPVATAPVDLDQDGDIDIAVANGGSANLSVLENRGAGSFAEPVNYPSARSPSFVAAGDLDLDGHVDLAASESGGSVSVFWNVGDGTSGGTFYGAHRLPIGQSPRSLIIADLGGDGRPDLVTANERNGSVSILVKRGGRLFFPAVEYGVGAGPRFVLAGDLDGDDFLDLVSANHESCDITVLLNTQRSPLAGEYLEEICTELDFHKVSVLSGGGGSGERLTKYVLPARDDPALLPTLFPDARRYPLHEDFLAAVFPARFDGLTQQEYNRLVARRESRDYYVGALTRVLTENGFLYAFTVVTDSGFDPGEVLTLEEIEYVEETVRGAFQLRPLAYEPDTELGKRQAERWVDPPFSIFFRDEEEPDVEPEASPTFALAIAADAVACGVFSEGRVGRELREEYETKSTVRFAEGVLELPTESSSFSADLFDEVRLGAPEELLEAAGVGVFQVLRIPSGAQETRYRFNYEQAFTLPGGERFAIQLFALDFRARGGMPVAKTLVLDEELITFELSMEGALEGEPVVSYASCSHELLPLWRVDVELEEGSSIQLEERFLPSENLIGTGPASLQRADVVLGGARQTVTDYWRLVYAARRHNVNAEYWVVLDPPLEISSAPGGAVHVVEVVAPEPSDGSEAQVHYLGEDFEVLGTPRVLDYRKVETEVLAGMRFRRSDVDTDGSVSINDALGLLGHLFGRLGPLPCPDAADVNDDGRLNVVDAIGIVSHLFRHHVPLPDPSVCGADPTADGLTCPSYESCE